MLLLKVDYSGTLFLISNELALVGLFDDEAIFNLASTSQLRLLYLPYIARLYFSMLYNIIILKLYILTIGHKAVSSI